MPNWINRLFGGGANTPAERKTFGGHSLMTLSALGPAQWSGRGYASLVNEGFMRNPVVYRCIRLIAEAATRVPLSVVVDGKAVSEHPLAELLAKPNGRQSGGEMLEAVYAYLQTAGNAYLQAGVVDGAVRALFVLRPDRMRVVAGADGWPVGYDYTAGGRTMRIGQGSEPEPGVLHMALFRPLDDHYGMGPLEAAQTSLDIHNASAHWNKALFDNAARPSGALVRFLQGLSTFATFGRGWTRRVADIRKTALAMVPATALSGDKRRVTMDILNGYRTYVVAAFMLIAGLAQVLGIDLPALDGGAAGHLIFEALAIIFLRKGFKGDLLRG